MDNCLICGSRTNFINKVKAKEYSYKQCSNCGGFILEPRNKAISRLKEVYKSEYFDWGSLKGLKKIIYNIRLFESYPEWIQRIAKKKGNVIDVGAGIPTFVKQMKDNGWTSYAQELSKKQGNIIQEDIGKHNVFIGDFEKVKLTENFFNVVTFWHVLEHVQNPQNTVKKVKKILKKNGLVFIEVPNANSLSWKMFGNNYSLLSVPAHLFYYSEESLQKLFAGNGFKVVEISYPLKYNSAFDFSLISKLKHNTGINNSSLWILFFYLFLPFSFLINFILSIFGHSEVIRIVGKKS